MSLFYHNSRNIVAILFEVGSEGDFSSAQNLAGTNYSDSCGYFPMTKL
jgi:hypothetical protein